MADQPTPRSYTPAMNRRMIKRGIIGLVVAVVLVTAVYLVQNTKDIDLPTKVNTVGWIAAIQQTGNGSQAVLIKPDGTIVPSPDYKEGVNDRDVVWRPDGNRVFFTSDRENGQVHIHRWNPGSNKVERRTVTRGTYNSLSFPSGDGAKGLVVLNGMVVEFDPVDGSTAPVIPPSRKSTQGSGEEGAVGSMEELYGRIGNSFKKAYRFGNGSIIGVLKGERGETLIIQDPRPVGGRWQAPMLIVSGDRIDLDFNTRIGKAVFAVERFQFPDPENVPQEFIKNGKVTLPFRHMLALVSQDGNVERMLVSQDDRNAFGSPVFSPDGNSVVAAIGDYQGDGNLKQRLLVTMPAREGAGMGASPLVRSAVYDVAFSPDGQKIAYVQTGPSGNRTIHLMNSDGSNDQELTQGKGSFSAPKFSPQVAGG